MKIANKLAPIFLIGALFFAQESACILQVNALHDSETAYCTRLINTSNGVELDYAARMLFYKEELVFSHRVEQWQFCIKNGKCESTRIFVPVYRPMTEQEKAAELVRAKAELLACMANQKNIFVCISKNNNTICGLMLAEHGKKQIDLAQYIQVYVNPNACVNCDDAMYSMTQYAENFYRNLYMNGIAIDLDSKNPDFYIKNGYVQLSWEQMVSKKLASRANFLGTAAMFAALAGFAGYCVSDNFLKPHADTSPNGIVAFFAAALSLPIVRACYDRVNNTVYYKAL